MARVAMVDSRREQLTQRVVSKHSEYGEAVKEKDAGV
jgi:hypothetical protein